MNIPYSIYALNQMYYLDNYIEGKHERDADPAKFKVHQYTYRFWSVILLSKSITTSHHLHSRGCLDESWIYWCAWPWCWINWNKANHKVGMVFSNLHCCSCVVSLGKVTSWAHFSKQQQASSTRQTLRDEQECQKVKTWIFLSFVLNHQCMQSCKPSTSVHQQSLDQRLCEHLLYLPSPIYGIYLCKKNPGLKSIDKRRSKKGRNGKKKLSLTLHTALLLCYQCLRTYGLQISWNYVFLRSANG